MIGQTSAAWCALVAVACLAGCASKQPTSQPSPSFQILESLPASGTIAPTDLYPLEPGTRRFLNIDTNADLIVTYSTTSDHDATIACAEGDQRVSYWRADEQDNIVMTVVFEAKDEALTQFAKPLLIARASFDKGVAAATSATMRVVDANDPSRQREFGKATRTLQYVDDQRIRTPMGEFTAKRISIRFRADLRMADVDEVTMLWIVPGTGIVAQSSTEQVKVMGVGKKKTRTLVLLEGG